MWFGVLGPLLISDGQTPVDVPKGRQRVLLAALLVHAGRPVPADLLAEIVWDGAPPAGALGTLRSHVLRLRRALGPRAGARLVTRYPGYLLQAAEEEVDLLRFRCLCREAGAAMRTGAWAQAEGVLGEALGLWRGTPFADIPSEVLKLQEASGLAELHLQASEWRIEARLNSGRHTEALSELRQLTGAYPLRERLHGLLMLALYRDGRQAEALAAYQNARQVLIDELGAEPGTELQSLHQRMLAGDAGEAEAPATPAPRPAIPRLLPGAVLHFTGRATELTALSRLLDQSGTQAPGTVVISAIGGTAGVGKTALAVHWAHQVAGQFPDGQLYVNLRGYDPGPLVTAADALAGFLRALGVPGQDIPPEEDDRAARYRSLLAGKRMLVVLDNAASAEQVRPLLPGTPACMVVATSRDALTGLVARDGATRLDLDVLPPQDAASLLRALIGPRADADLDAVAELATQCCRLPLALRVAAELAGARSATPLGDLAAELADQRKRLDLLDAGLDPRTAVRAVFSWSYHHLDAATARTFRLLGLHPGTDFDRYAVAALTAMTAEQADQVMDVLARAHLIQAAGPRRCSMHDLLRAYAHELAVARDGDGDGVEQALTGLLDYYLHSTAAAIDTVLPAEAGRPPRVPQSATPAPPLADPAVARAWLDAEQANLVAAAVYAAANGRQGHATRFSATLGRYLENGGHFAEAFTLQSHARDAARRAGDRAAEATALNSLGLVAWWRGQYEQAAGHLRQALALHRESDDQSGQAYVLANLGIVMGQQGRYEQAAGHLRQALALHRETGDRTGEARALSNLGMVDKELGRYEQAASLYRQSLTLSRENGDPNSEAYGLVNLGEIEGLLGHFDQAIGHLRQGLDLFRKVGNRSAQAGPLAWLGEVEMRQGHHKLAADYYRQSLTLSRELGDPAHETDARNGLGETFLAAGRPEDARTQHIAALGLAARIGHKLGQARAHNGLARSLLATGDHGQARQHWQQALTLYTNLGAPEADQVRVQLATAEDQDHHNPASLTGS
jgi:DNA-binding SARP family transcriptional activator/Tfp pilus assembly protein PilF